MKTIMIFGLCRTGKSTFSRMIQEKYKNYQIIEVDTIISALQKTVENVPIGFIHDNLEENKLPQFLNLLIQKNIQKNHNELGLIVNGDSIMPEDLAKYFNLENMKIYYFVHPELSTEEIVKRCRKYDNNNEWTTRRSDEQLIKHMNFYKEIEKKIIEQCKKYGFKCVDTSNNMMEILKNLLKEIDEDER